MNKTTIPIKGMHCRSCELLIENELSHLSGVSKVEVNYRNKGACVYHNTHILDRGEVEKAVKRAGYEVGMEEKKPFLSRSFDDYIEVAVSVIAVFLLYMILEIFGVSKLLSTSTNHPSGLIAVMLIGLTAGFSTCMALIGGLVLGVSARFDQKHGELSALEKFKPHLFFNLGRICSYIILGGFIGALGGIFQISGFGLGLLTVAVALVMFHLGLQLTGLFPRLSGVSFTLPSSIGKFLGIQQKQELGYSHGNTALLGALTFFLPCGFTQAMQLLAMSTGSFSKGAAIMGAFAIGTAPGLLGVGGLTSVIKGAIAQKFFRFAGVIVTLLAVFNLSNGLNLIGFNPLYALGLSTNALAANGNGVNIQDNIQIVNMTQSAQGYSPNTFTIVKDIPVKWVINSTDPNTCASMLVSDKLNLRRNLHPGENFVEFTPTEVGQIPFSCSMGMFTGVFYVVADKNAAAGQAVQAAAPINPPAPKGAGCGMGGGCGCGGGRKAAVQEQDVTPVVAIKEGTSQLLQTTYTSEKDISPNVFIVKKNTPVRMEIDVQDQGQGCMSTITIPKLADDPKFLAQGTTITFDFTPKDKGDYPITCAMGIPRGVIKVV